MRGRGENDDFSLHVQPLERALLAPGFLHLHERNRPRAIGAVLLGAVVELAFVVVVAGRAFLEEFAEEDGERLDRLHPLLFGLLRRFQSAGLAVYRFSDDVARVARLLVQHVRIVRGEARLRVREDDAVRGAAHLHAVERLHAVGPQLAPNAARGKELALITPRRVTSRRR